jgi:diguanylate cyclase (GGDEF)-like protein
LGPLRTTGQAMLTIALALLACLAQFLDLRATGRQRQAVTLAFLAVAALLLPPLALVVVAVVPFAVDQAARPRAWYAASFETAIHLIATVLAGVAARAVLRASSGHADGLSRANSPEAMALAGLCAAVILLLVTHASLLRMLQLSRRAPVGDSGLFHFESLFTDASLLSIGVAAALLWHAAPALTAFLLLPLLLLQRGLKFPQLQEESRRDAKTGLWNAGYLRHVGNTEVHRSARTRSACSVLIADLDLLRDINNTYGHLAGDAVLEGVSRILQEQVRDYDLVARFGGEEFVVLLPDTPHHTACAVAERIRARIASAPFLVPTSGEPLVATLSLGVATTPEHGMTLDALLHRADLALYRAKEAGRNRVAGANATDDASTAPTVPVAADLVPSPRRVESISAEHGAPARSAHQAVVTTPSDFDLPVRPGTHGVRSPNSWALTAQVLIGSIVGAFLLVFLTQGTSLFGDQPQPLPFVLFPLLATAAVILTRAGTPRVAEGFLMLPAAVVLSVVYTGRPITCCVTAATAALVGAAAQRRSFEEALCRLGAWELAGAVAYAARHELVSAQDSSFVALLVAMLIAAPLFVATERSLGCLWASRQGVHTWHRLAWAGYVRDVRSAFGIALGATLLGFAYAHYGWGVGVLVLLALGSVVVSASRLDRHVRPRPVVRLDPEPIERVPVAIR